VDTYWKKIKAAELVSDILGVMGVDNALSVVPTEGRLDTLIADDIMATLKRSTNIDINTVEVTVENGVVTLSGTVPDWSALQKAEAVARYTGGIVDVINDLSPKAS
jgi:osmotically-inducible protein OsmY